MASVHLEEKANFKRLSRLLVDKGTEALRNTLDAIHPPANLPAVLNANTKSLLRLKFRFINNHQWDLLFPPSGNPPDSKSFDVTLLTILLRNICGLASPATGWNTMPPDTNRSLQANVIRVKLFRSQLYAHVDSSQVDSTTFENLWQEASKAFVDLKIPQKEIDDFKMCPLGPEEEIYVQKFKEWFLEEKNLNDMLLDLEQFIQRLKEVERGLYVFFANFVRGYLAKHDGARRLVTLTEARQRLVRFNDIDEISTIYCNFMEENGIKVPRRDFNRGKHIYKIIMILLEREGLLQRVAHGTDYGKEYLKYEVKDGKLWDSLIMNYGVPRSARKIRRNYGDSNTALSSEPSSDRGEQYDEELARGGDLEVQLGEREQDLRYYEEAIKRRNLEIRERELANQLRAYKETIERLKLEIQQRDQALQLKANRETIEGHNVRKRKRDSPDSWEWEKKSITHREKFIKLHDHGRDRPQEIQEVNDVRFCCSKEFLIGRGSDATRVYVGLSKDGCERAVKRLPNDDDHCTNLAEQEKKILNQPNAIKSNHVVKYRFLDKTDKDWLFLITDLCEETLEDYVKSSSLDDGSKIAQNIIKQVLTGVADIHRDPKRILHRDLKPSNILRDVDGNWLLADFGISRILTPDVSTFRSGMKGTDHWRAVESCSSNGTCSTGKVRYKKASDIQVAGMVAFYTVTEGEHPFGEKRDQLGNILDGKPVGLVKLKDPAAKDLISWMLSHDPKDRPSAEEALKHPYLQPAEQQFKMLSEVGNQREIKTWRANADVKTELNKLPKVWQDQMDPEVLQYLCTNVVTGQTYRYGQSWSELLRLIRNVDQHWYDPPRPLPQPRKEFYLVGDPQEYFLNLFPNLPVEVHKIVRSCDWKERPKLKEYFIANIKDKS